MSFWVGKKQQKTGPYEHRDELKGFLAVFIICYFCLEFSNGSLSCHTVHYPKPILQYKHPLMGIGTGAGKNL